MASPPPVPDVHISTELPHLTKVLEAEAAEQEVVVATEGHTTSLKGWFSQFLQILCVVINCGDFDVVCIGVPDDGSAGGDLHQLAQGLSSFEFIDDDEQIVQCLEHVRLLSLPWYFSRLAS
jgi:hypothetical protein